MNKRFFSAPHPTPPDRQINEAIQATQVLVLTPDGKKVGPVSHKVALAMARDLELDLMLVSRPDARVVVCRILDYAKYRFDLSKKQKYQRQKVQTIIKKEIRLKVMIDTHDLQIKVNRARLFLTKNYHVKLSLRFRGREVTHPELGYETLHKFIRQLEDIAIISKQMVRDRMVLSCELRPSTARKKQAPVEHA